MLVGTVTAGTTHSTLTYGWADLMYLRTGDAGNDALFGAVTGPRGQRVIEGQVMSAQGGVGHQRGVAERIALDGYHAGAHSVHVWNVATYGVPAVNHSPASNGQQWRNALRSLTRLVRLWVQAEVAAGRQVRCQVLDIKQGEAEASARQAAVTQPEIDAADAAIAAWAGVWRDTLSYYGEKFGVSMPVAFTQLMPVRVSNSSGAALDGPTVTMNANAKALCRYVVPVNTDGTIGTIVDQGPAAGRLNNGYFLEHNFNAPVWTEVHFTVAHQIALGRALVWVEKHIAGLATATSLTGFQITRIAPVALQAPALVSVTHNSITVSVRADEKCFARVLALADGSAAPTAATVVSTGTQFVLTEDASTGATTATNLVLTGLAASTAYDIYVVLVDDVHGHAGSVSARIDASTVAAPTAAAAWDTTIGVTAPAQIAYTNSGATASTTATTAGARFTRVPDALAVTSGKWFAQVTFTGAASGGLTRGVGLGTSVIGGSNGVQGGANGSTRWWRAGTTINTNSTTVTGMPSLNSPNRSVQIAFDATADLAWWREVGGLWNGSAGADPATGVGGLSISGRGASALYLMAGLPNTTAASGVTLDSATPPSGFTQLGGSVASGVYETGVYETGVYE